MTSRYIPSHLHPSGPGDARPTAAQIIANDSLQGALAGKTIFVTGCSSGIGIETARALFLTGATLYLTARNLPAARSALGDLLASERVNLLELELGSLSNVRACAAEFLSREDKLDVLVCNAGVMTTPEGRTRDGFETQFGTNHLSHFLLFTLLLPSLLAASTPTHHSRVVLVSSVAHRLGEPDLANINLQGGTYDPMKAYAASKTANLWTANEIERRYGSQGLHAWSLQPGAIMTNLARHLSEEQKAGLGADPYLAKIFKNPEQGAATTVWAATAPALEGQGGKYLENCQIIGPYDPAGEVWGPGYGVHAYDEEKAAKLWEKSVEWVKQ